MWGIRIPSRLLLQAEHCMKYNSYLTLMSSSKDSYSISFRTFKRLYIYPFKKRSHPSGISSNDTAIDYLIMIFVFMYYEQNKSRIESHLVKKIRMPALRAKSTRLIVPLLLHTPRVFLNLVFTLSHNTEGKI